MWGPEVRPNVSQPAGAFRLQLQHLRGLLGPLAILPDYADVAQLARASPCHGEGRGFEPLHPLSETPRPAGRFSFYAPMPSRPCGRSQSSAGPSGTIGDGFSCPCVIK